MGCILRAWIVYDKERAKGNERFVLHFSRGLKKHGFEVEVVYTEDADLGNPPDIAVMRTYNMEFHVRLADAGVYILNNAQTAIFGNNKFLAYRLAEKARLNVMPYYLVKNPRAKMEPQVPPCFIGRNKNIVVVKSALIKRQTAEEHAIDKIPDRFPLVAKSVDGHGGDEVFWINSLDDFYKCCDTLKEDFILQEPCDTLGKDVRVYIIGGEIVTAVLRESTNDFRSNFSLGGKVSPYNLSAKEIREVRKISKCIDIDYGGIDFIFHKGKLFFNEIEDIVGAKNIYMFGDMDILGLFADYIAKETGVKPNGNSK